MLVIVAAISELERSLIVERVKNGMRRAKLEVRQIGRAQLHINGEQVVQDRRGGMSLTQVANRRSISRASVCRLMKEFSGHSPSSAAAGFGADHLVQVAMGDCSL
jgi:DNA invertase Pin-like site-specific DNA recombinase